MALGLSLTWESPVLAAGTTWPPVPTVPSNQPLTRTDSPCPWLPLTPPRPPFPLSRHTPHLGPSRSEIGTRDTEGQRGPPTSAWTRLVLAGASDSGRENLLPVPLIRVPCGLLWGAVRCPRGHGAKAKALAAGRGLWVGALSGSFLHPAATRPSTEWHSPGPAACRVRRRAAPRWPPDLVLQRGAPVGWPPAPLPAPRLPGCHIAGEAWRPQGCGAPRPLWLKEGPGLCL